MTMWLIHALLWSRFKEDAVGNFVDMCSMCNVSVFILSHNNRLRLSSAGLQSSLPMSY